jgi:predicted O-methyltransferase YrrM
MKEKEIKKENDMLSVLKKSYIIKKIWIATSPWISRVFVIGRIKKFNTDSGEDALNFIQSLFFGFAIRLAQVRNEFLELLKIFKEKSPEVVVEIGTAKGGTLFCFSKLAPQNATIISVDLPDGNFGGGYPKSKIPLYQSFKKNGQKMFLLREDSHSEKTVQKLKEILNGKKVDFLFIDADHTYEGVKRDFELYSLLMAKNGIISFHDIAPIPGVSRTFVNAFWNEIKINYKYKELIENKDQGWAGIGVLFLN